MGWTLVRFWSLSNPVEKVIKTTIWEPLFKLVYLSLIIEKLYLIAEVEHFKQTFRFKYLIANNFYLWISLSCG